MEYTNDNLYRTIFICKCESLEHQVAFYYDEENNEIHIEPHLNTNRTFFQRIILAFKYIFGYKTVFGAWDDMMLKDEDVLKLYNIIKKDYKKIKKSAKK